LITSVHPLYTEAHYRSVFNFPIILLLLLLLTIIIIIIIITTWKTKGSTPNDSKHFLNEVRKCLLSFGAEPFVFQFAIQKFKDQDI